MQLSVIICTHNPRPDYLKRTLDALEAQTLPREQWELLFIDNASKGSLAGEWDLSWHPHARHVREEELGLTAARFRGIREAAAGLLVFVDDDNVLAPDYLSNALKLTLSHAWVGAFGGNIIGEFESKPERWAEVMLPSLAIVQVKQEEWACSPGTRAAYTAPCGAGMVVRREIATYYAGRSANDPLRRSLGRKGASLASGEDSDLAFCACALGFAVGRFPQLQLTHLISAARLKRDYLLRLAEEMAFSIAVLQFIWDGKLPGQDTAPGLKKIYWNYQSFRNRLRGKDYTFADEFRKAADRGIARAARILKSPRNGTGGTPKS